MRTITTIQTVLLLFVLSLAVAGCGSSSEKDERQDELEMTEAELDRVKQEIEKAEAEAANAKAEAGKARAEAEKAKAEADAEKRSADAAEAAQREAENERERLENEAAETERKLAQTHAKFAFDGMVTDANSAGAVSVTPQYRALARVTTTPAVAFRNSNTSTSRRWFISSFSNSSATHDDELVVFSDVNAPGRQAIRDFPAYETDFDSDGTIDADGISITTDRGGLVKSPAFPTGGLEKTFPLSDDMGTPDDARDDTTGRISGSLHGVPGYFECQHTDACVITHKGASYEITTGTWWFIPGSPTSPISIPDASYMHFGWWKRVQKSDDAYSFGTFSGGTVPVTANEFNSLDGTATYVGPAIGQYAIYQPLGAQSAAGSFTATASLSADFAANTLSGGVTGFSNSPDWELTFNQKLMSGGTVSDGVVNWTISGNTEVGGTWDGAFFSKYAAYGGEEPDGITGTFTAAYDDVGRIAGAYGAHKQ